MASRRNPPGTGSIIILAAVMAVLLTAACVLCQGVFEP